MLIPIAEYACDDALKRILKLAKYRLQIVRLEDQYFLFLIITTIKIPSHIYKAEKTCSQTCACDLYDLYGDKASSRLTLKQCYYNDAQVAS